MDQMRKEALERMKLLKINEKQISIYENSYQIPLTVVDDENKQLIHDLLSDEEFKIAVQYQEENGHLIYYAIRQKGYLMDGTEFEKVTFLVVTKYQEDWDYNRSEILKGRTEAYVYNKLYPDYSEYCEIKFQNVHGMIVSCS